MESWVGREEESRADLLKVLFYELNTAISPRDNRIAALKSVLHECNHFEPDKHDEELDLYADKILFQKLAFLFTVKKEDDEIGLLACALEMVYRASRSRVALSFSEMGDNTLPLFVDMIRCDVSFPPVPPPLNTSSRSIISSNGDNIEKNNEKNGKDRDPNEDSKSTIELNRNEKIDSKIVDCATESPPMVSENDYNGGQFVDQNKIESLNAAKSQPRGDVLTHCTSATVSSSGSNTVQQDIPSPLPNPLSMMMMMNSSGRRWKCSTNPMAVRKIIKVLRYYSRVLSAMIPMAHHAGLLDAIIFQLQWGQQNPKSITIAPQLDSSRELASSKDNNDRIIRNNENLRMAVDLTGAARIDAMAILVNLACAEENKTKLLYHPGLLEAVITVASDDSVDEAREHAAIVLMNLALADTNKVFMTNQDHLLNTLLKLVGEDKSTHTRRYASTTIFSLASFAQNTQRIVEYSKGRILSALTKVLRCDDVDEVRINAAETLFNMTKNSDDIDMVEAMADHRDLLSTLANAVVSDYCADVRAYCARALEWLAADIHSPSPCHGSLLDALTSASSWTKTTCIGEALKTQASLVQNRKAMGEKESLLDALATLASLDGVNDDDVRDCALVAIERLTMEESIQVFMVAHPGIMTALTRATFQKSVALECFGVEEEFGDKNDGDLDSCSNEGKFLAKSALKNLAQVL